MSDLLLGQPPLMVLPVIGAVVFVVAVYAFAVRPSPTPSFTLLEDAPSKKAKAAKKKQKPVKKEKVSNGHITAVSDSGKSSTSTGRSTATKQSSQKQPEAAAPKKKAAEVKSEKEASEKYAALKSEKAAMKKEAAQGDWVTVGSKDKKQKARSTPEPQANDKATASSKSEEVATNSQAPTSSNPSVVDKKESAKKDASIGGKPTLNASEASSDKVIKNGAVADSQISKSKSKSSSKDSKDAKSKPKATTTPSAGQKTKSSTSKKEDSISQKDTSTEPTKLKNNVETEAPTAPAATPTSEPQTTDTAFDEMGDWEQAKPLKMKKRARRER